MTSPEFQDLVGLLVKRFDRIDRQFEQVDRRFEAIDRRFEAIDRQFEEFGHRFEAIDGQFEEFGHRFEAIETRLTRVEVGQESLRTDVQAVAELATANGRRIDETRLAVDALTERVELNGLGIRAVRDRVASLEDHLRAV